jgi:hypothetical protein
MRFCTWNVKISYRVGSLRRVAGEAVTCTLRLAGGYFELKQYKTRLGEGRSKQETSQARMATRDIL